MQDQALLESVSEIVTLAGDGINAALADLSAQSEESDYSEALEACQGGVETIAMAAEMAELERLQQICGALTEHFGSLNGHASEFLRNHGPVLAGWSSTVLAYIQAPADPDSKTLDEALLAPLPDELRTRFMPQIEASNDGFDEAANGSDDLPKQAVDQPTEADNDAIEPVSAGENDVFELDADHDPDLVEASEAVTEFTDSGITEREFSEVETAADNVDVAEENLEVPEAPDLVPELAATSDAALELDAHFDADDIISEETDSADEWPVDTDLAALETTDTESESDAEVFIGKFIDDATENPVEDLSEEVAPVILESSLADDVPAADVFAGDAEEERLSAIRNTEEENSAPGDDVNSPGFDLNSHIESTLSEPMSGSTEADSAESALTSDLADDA
ncbi:MAG: hypothetical protein KDJ99_00465, partial [Candidatus Competibacteraceae bacterium]|nr:hypothetical protein [Candidatus Competibacteraceae bacterium]